MENIINELSEELLVFDRGKIVTNREVQLWCSQSKEWPKNQPRLRIAGELVSMSSIQPKMKGVSTRVRMWQWHTSDRELMLEGPHEFDLLRQFAERAPKELSLFARYLVVLRIDIEAPRPIDVKPPYRNLKFRMFRERTYWFFTQKSKEEFHQACIDLVNTNLLASIGALPPNSFD